MITWIGAPVLRDQRCVVDTSRNCSTVFCFPTQQEFVLSVVVFSVAQWEL